MSSCIDVTHRWPKVSICVLLASRCSGNCSGCGGKGSGELCVGGHAAERCVMVCYVVSEKNLREARCHRFLYTRLTGMGSKAKPRQLHCRDMGMCTACPSRHVYSLPKRYPAKPLCLHCKACWHKIHRYLTCRVLERSHHVGCRSGALGVCNVSVAMTCTSCRPTPLGPGDRHGDREQRCQTLSRRANGGESFAGPVEVFTIIANPDEAEDSPPPESIEVAHDQEEHAGKGRPHS